VRRAWRIIAVLGLLLAGGGWPSISPETAIDRRPDYQAPALLERAWALPLAARLPRPPLPQPNVSACGPTSLMNVGRALGQPSLSLAELTSGESRCLRGLCLGGFTLDELASLAARHVSGWQVTVVHPSSATALREVLRAAPTKGQLVIANFTRAPLFGRGGGHHSPLGGLLEPEDLVFVVDVNADYGPWLAPTQRLFEAIDTTDPSSGEKRGLLIIEAARPIDH